jgi:16S rRNA (guanine1207-N2)-methyltransferase
VGTALLLETLAEQRPPERILDLGCGVGPLALWGLARWPDARATLLDGDARACASATRNATSLGVDARCRVDWWDAEEPCPETGFDLALVNPPFHGGKAVDLRPARSMFTRLAESLAMGGRALIVANRTLPYEAPLAEFGAFEAVRTGRGYKIIAFTRRTPPRNPRAGKPRRSSVADRR